MKIDNPFYINLPIIDLHGESQETAIYRLESFVKEQNIIGNTKILVIHGIGQRILQKTIRNYINKHPLYFFELDLYNDGITIMNITPKNPKNN